MASKKVKTGRLGRVQYPGIDKITAILDTVEMIATRDIEDVDFLRSLLVSFVAIERESLRKKGYEI